MLEKVVFLKSHPMAKLCGAKGKFSTEMAELYIVSQNMSGVT
ncbi:hypothetical protein [Halocynthiibacter sp.]